MLGSETASVSQILFTYQNLSFMMVVLFLWVFLDLVNIGCNHSLFFQTSSYWIHHSVYKMYIPTNPVIDAFKRQSCYKDKGVFKIMGL